jgi:hypothetical protein
VKYEDWRVLGSSLATGLPHCQASTEKENFPGEDEWARAATRFETGIGGPEIKDPKSKKVEKDLHRHLAWIQILCEVDRKFLASLDLRLMTDALFTVALPG